MSVSIELSYRKDTGELTGMSNNFNLFRTPSKDYVYRKGKLREILSDELYKASPSWFRVYINQYDYALQESFIKELHHITYDIVKEYVEFKDPFDIPKDAYIGHTMEVSDRRKRDEEIIQEIYNKKYFGKWYTKEYDDGEVIEIMITKNDSYVKVGGNIYLDIISRYEEDDFYYTYTGNIEEPFNINKLEPSR